MPSSAEISVVDTFGSPKRLNNSSVTSRMRSAVRRGGRLGSLAIVPRTLASTPSRVHRHRHHASARAAGCLQSRLFMSDRTPAISFQNVGKTYGGAHGAVRALTDVSF